MAEKLPQPQSGFGNFLFNLIHLFVQFHTVSLNVLLADFQRERTALGIGHSTVLLASVVHPITHTICQVFGIQTLAHFGAGRLQVGEHVVDDLAHFLFHRLLLYAVQSTYIIAQHIKCRKCFFINFL